MKEEAFKADTLFDASSANGKRKRIRQNNGDSVACSISLNLELLCAVSRGVVTFFVADSIMLAELQSLFGTFVLQVGSRRSRRFLLPSNLHRRHLARNKP